MLATGRRLADGECAAEEALRFVGAALPEQAGQAVQPVQQSHVVLAEPPRQHVESAAIEPFGGVAILFGRVT